MKKICFITCYFGKWPQWFHFFLKSCYANPSINWLIYTDCKIPDNKQSNVQFIRGDLETLSILASKKLAFPVQIPYYYKICDFQNKMGLFRPGGH